VPFGGMVSFKIKGGGEEGTSESSLDAFSSFRTRGRLTFALPLALSFKADQFLQASHLFCLAESLGGVESLAEVPDKMTHA